MKYVYFDLGNVIFHFSHQRACRQIATAADVSPEIVQTLLFENGLEDEYETGLISTEEFHARFCQATGSSLIVDDLLLAASNIFQLNTEIVTVIEFLRAREVDYGILSNTCPAHWTFINEQFPIVGEYFSHTILSYEVQSMKPDPVIYEAAIKSAQVEPGEIFFMDDKVENVDGALKAGIDAVVFKSAAELMQQLNVRLQDS